MQDIEKLILSIEKKGWEASKTKDPSFYQTYMERECPIITPFGTFTRDMVISEMLNTSQKILNYELINPQIVVLRNDLIVISYKAMTESSQNDKIEKKYSWVTTVYENKEDRWIFTLNQHIPL